jgi:hypothetical protein
MTSMGRFGFLNHVKDHPIWFATILIWNGFLADYLSLWKTRYLIVKMTRREGYYLAFALVPVDLVLSVSITLAALFVYEFLLATYTGIGTHDFINHTNQLASIDTGRFAVFVAILAYSSSTFLTSIWTMLVIISTIIIKLLAPIQRFTAWYFDLDRRPVTAIGIVAGTLVIIVSLIWQWCD